MTTGLLPAPRPPAQAPDVKAPDVKAPDVKAPDAEAPDAAGRSGRPVLWVLLEVSAVLVIASPCSTSSRAGTGGRGRVAS